MLPPLANLSIDNEVSEAGGSCAMASAAARPRLSTDAGGMLRASFVGRFPPQCGPVTSNIAVLDHSQFFAQGFLALWRSTGGSFAGPIVEGKVPTTARPVATHHGPVLGSIVYDINKFSNNVMARNLFLTLGAVVGKPPATPEQSAQRDPGLPPQERHRRARAAARQRLGPVARRARQRAHARRAAAGRQREPGRAGLRRIAADRRGGRHHGAAPDQPAGVLGNAHIKTGTLRDVRAIAGYVASADGNSYVVVSFINDPRASAARAAHDALLEWVYSGPGQTAE